MNYYNEFEPKAAAALRQLVKDGLIPHGDVDTRSITDVRAEDLKQYTQCHFFAGIGGWSRALEIAGWPASRPVWTGSCPCQPFSSAGKQKGFADERHLWPVWFNLIRECKPPVIFGEQVSAAVSHGWLDGVFTDLETEGYAIGSAVLPACSVNAPHKRDRLWFVAHSQRERLEGGSQDSRFRCNKQVENDGEKVWIGSKSSCGDGDMGKTKHDGRNGSQIFRSNEEAVLVCKEGTNCSSKPSGTGSSGIVSCGTVVNAKGVGSHEGQISERGAATGGDEKQPESIRSGGGFWARSDWVMCGDGKARRIPAAESGIRLLVNGFPERVGLLRAGGNAIVPEVAARFIKAAM